MSRSSRKYIYSGQSFLPAQKPPHPSQSVPGGGPRRGSDPVRQPPPPTLSQSQMYKTTVYAIIVYTIVLFASVNSCGSRPYSAWMLLLSAKRITFTLFSHHSWYQSRDLTMAVLRFWLIRSSKPGGGVGKGYQLTMEDIEICLILYHRKTITTTCQ